MSNSHQHFEMIRERAEQLLSELSAQHIPELLDGRKAVDTVLTGTCPRTITPGCLVLEGGALRAMYTEGVLDVLMREGINLQTVIGVSAGALSAVGYISGMVGWCARINLWYRHDPRYIGAAALKTDHGITGFSYLFGTIMTEHSIDMKRFLDPERRLVAVATNLNTGDPAYFEKGKGDIFTGIRASATIPYVSTPVFIDQIPYLDGGTSDPIPFDWAVRQGFKKIVIVRTRNRDYRRKMRQYSEANQLYYHDYPSYERRLEEANEEYNRLLNRLDEEEKAGHCWQICPSMPVTISRFEPDTRKLAQLYQQGVQDARYQLSGLKKYLGQRED